MPLVEEIILEPSGDTYPIGAITEFGGETAPTNWLFCNGQAVSRETYSELFEVIGTAYGEGNGSTTFNVPDFSSRSPMGVGTGTDGTNSETTTLGQEKGEYKHTLTTNEMPSHNHMFKFTKQVSNPSDGIDEIYFGIGRIYNTGDNSNKTENKGDDQPHNTVHPVLGVNYIIKAKQSVGVVGTVTSDINDTNDNAVPNAKTVKDYVEDVYSTDEVKTNKIWIDGKPIYRKVVTGTINATGNNQVILTGNIDSLIDYSGYINDPAENLKLIIGKSTYTDGGSSRIIQISNSLYMGYANNYHNLSFYAVVEYTKTTN